jgi:MFS transporter, putative metabolite:H+ symporter
VNPAASSEAASPSQLIARLERTPFSRWHRKARILMGSATFFDAYNALSLAFALPVLIRPWHITPAQIGVLLGAGYVGQLAGALLFGWLAEKYGRVYSAAGAVAIMSVMSLVCALSGSFNALLVCRILQGIGVGGEMPVAATYINELSRAHGRGRFFLLYEMIFPLGLMAAGQIGAWLVPIFGWKIMFLIGGIPGLLITGMVARLPESPRWLVSQGRLEEAEKIIERIESSVPDGARAGVTPGLALSAVAAPPPALARGRWSEVVSASYRGRTTVVWALWACAYFVSNGLNNWMPSLYNTVYHLPVAQALRAASMTNVAQVALLLICALLIDRAGRRNWMVTAFLATAGFLAVLGFAAAQSVMAVMILATVSYGAVGSANAVLYLYTPEIYPTRIRAIATALATSWLRLTSAIGPPIVGLMVGSAGVGSVFIMFASVSCVGAIVARQMIETRGRKLEEIAT